MPSLPKLDHTVINARFKMDEAEAAFSGLGFHLTERGYHTLGSINHLMMFGTDYLELIGLPADADRENSGRPDVAKAPYGINGLVFKTDDVDETFGHLQSIGMAALPPKSFSRPVELDGKTVDASFRTVHVDGDAFPAGRVYFCQHLTPQYVWRPEWQSHANGAASITEFVVVANEAQAQADGFAKLLRSEVMGADGALRVAIEGAVISVLSPEAYAARYGALASSMAGRASIFGAIVMKSENLDSVREIAKRAGVPTIDTDNSVALRQSQFDSVLEFTT